MKVFIVGGDRLVSRMFERKGYDIISSPVPTHDVDLLVFTGGSDISPFLYGEKPLPSTSFDIKRDLTDIYFWKAFPPAFPKIGICRGAQMGNVLSGGRLWQDVDKHAGTRHLVRDLLSMTKDGTYRYVYVSSAHHQQVILTEEALTLATANESTIRRGARLSQKNQNDWKDVEAFYYPTTNFLGVQFHPEFPGAESGTEYFWELCDTWLEPKKTKKTKESLIL